MGGHFRTGTFKTLEDAVEELVRANKFMTETYKLFLEDVQIEYKSDKELFILRAYWST